MFYSQVNPNGYITLSMYTVDPAAVVPEGYRLLPDNPPQAPQVNRLTHSVNRIEPVPYDALEIIYEVVQLLVSNREYEVVL
jgi:hypothetical protein